MAVKVSIYHFIGTLLIGVVSLITSKKVAAIIDPVSTNQHPVAATLVTLVIISIVGVAISTLIMSINEKSMGTPLKETSETLQDKKP